MLDVAVKFEWVPGYFRIVVSDGSSVIPRPPNGTVVPSREQTVIYLQLYVSSIAVDSLDPLYYRPYSIVGHNVAPIAFPPFTGRTSTRFHVDPVTPTPLVAHVPQRTGELPGS